MEKSNKLSYLSFAIEDEMFAISVTKVLEVLQKIKITRVPSSPKHVEGVINFRGEIIPIFDTRTKFGLPKRSE
ncbi:MAG: chemotaxis protein CheW, partial [Bacteroidales bacterium]|nr:chemotaxis protein CheW [Bacteroidales bacterium]